MAYANGKNPFMDDPDDDLFGGRRSEGNGSSKYGAEYGRNNLNDDPPPYSDGAQLSDRALKQQQMQLSMNRQLDGTQRCLASIFESEQIGIATAEKTLPWFLAEIIPENVIKLKGGNPNHDGVIKELVQQGEKLDNIEQKVDKINADTKVSQRHLNSIKSVFGGIRNWWNGEGKKDDAPATTTGLSRDRQQLRQTISTTSSADYSNSSSMHPSLRLRSDDVRGFYDEDVVEFGAPMSSSRPEERRTAGSSSASSQLQSSSTRSAEFQEYERGLNSNLDMMSSGMAQLKNLALGLGDEIKAQNDQLDRIAPKVDRADTKIRDQNRQMRQILGK